MKKFSFLDFFFTTLLLTFSMVSQKSYAQQLPLFAQYREMHGLINPASVNSDYLLYHIRAFGGLGARMQWTSGTKDSGFPRTQVLHGSYLWERDNSSLLFGAHLINDQVGRVGTTGLTARFAVILSDDPFEHGLVGGLNVGINNYRVNLTNARTHDPGDVKASQNQSIFYPDAGLGVFGYQRFSNDNFMYGGISVPQILGLNLQFRGENNEFSIKQVRHYYAQGGYLFHLRDEYSFIEVSSWVKYVPKTPVNADINIRYRMGSIFWVGSGFNTSGMLHLDVGVVLGAENSENIYKLGFGNSSSLSRLRPYFGNTRELNLGVGFGNF